MQRQVGELKRVAVATGNNDGWHNSLNIQTGFTVRGNSRAQSRRGENKKQPCQDTYRPYNYSSSALV